VFGRGENCDVVLADPTLLNEHVKLQTEGTGTFQLIPFEGATFHINGRPYGTSAPLQPFQYVLIGKTLFALGPAGQMWPDLSESNAPPLVTETAEQPAEEEGKEEPVPEPEAEESPPIENTTPLPATAPDEKKEETVSPPPPAPEPQKKFRWKFWGLRVALPTMVLMGIGGYGLLRLCRGQEETTPISSVPSVPPKDRIFKELLDLNVEKDFIELREINGAFEIEAYVGTNAEKTKIIHQIRSLRLPIRSIFIRSQETILSSARDVIKTLGYVLSAEALPHPDGLLLRGYLLDINQLQTIKNRLFLDVPGLRKIETNVLSAGDANDIAYQLLEKYQLAGLVKIVPAEEGLVLYGHIEERDNGTWKQVYKDLRKAFENVCRLTARVNVLPLLILKKDFFEAHVESVTVSEVNHTAWVDLQNGQRYFESSLLPSGYIIQKIAPDGIVLSKNGEVVQFKAEEL
jgi:type III secretion system YscD/HrpQ family protein